MSKSSEGCILSYKKNEILWKLVEINSQIYSDSGGNDEKTVNNEKFYRYLASVIQNFALSTQPLGGLYLVGGMLSAKDLKKYDLIKQLINHPTMQPLLKKVPVYLIVNKNLAFIGLSKLAKKSCLT